MNAVFERDYVAFSSSWRFLLLRGGFAAGMGLLLAFRLLVSADVDIGVSLLSGAVVLGSVLLALAAPGSFGTVLVHTRASGGLPVLFATPLRPLDIAWGAFAARAGVLLLLVLATCPPLAFALLFGGIRGTQILQAVAGVSATVLLLGAPAFVISAFAQRTAAAVVTAYLSSAALFAGTALAGDAVARTLHDPQLAAAVSPYHALALAVDVRAQVAGTLPGVVWLLALSIVASAAAVVVAAWRLDREARGLTEVHRTLVSTRTCRPLRHENPVLDHELRRGALLGARNPARGLVAVLLAAEGAFALSVRYGIEATSVDANAAVLAFELFLILLAVASAGATSLAEEKETHSLELLRAAPLRPAHVVLGKLAGVLRALLPCMAVPVLHLAWMAWKGIVSPFAVPAFLVAATLVFATWATLGVHQSLEEREPRRAVARTMTLLGIVAVLIAGCIGLPLWSILQSNHADPYTAAAAAFGANPVAAALLPVALLREGGATSSTAVLRAPTSGELAAGGLALAIWLGAHLVLWQVLYVRLARLYRARTDG